MSELKIFENPAFGRVRTVDRGGEPWFVGKDVATALGYSDQAKAIRIHVDEEDKGVDEMAKKKKVKRIGPEKRKAAHLRADRIKFRKKFLLNSL